MLKVAKSNNKIAEMSEKKHKPYKYLTLAEKKQVIDGSRVGVSGRCMKYIDILAKYAVKKAPDALF
jgi:hypothetical protein